MRDRREPLNGGLCGPGHHLVPVSEEVSVHPYDAGPTEPQCRPRPLYWIWVQEGNWSGPGSLEMLAHHIPASLSLAASAA